MEIDSILLVGAQYAGLVAMAIAWCVIVAMPLYRLKVSHRRETISTALARHADVLSVVNVGLVVGALFQGWFAWYVVERFSIAPSHPGVLIYWAMCGATVLAALFTPARNPAMHFYTAAFYFFIAPLMMVLVGIAIGPAELVAYATSLACALLYGVGGRP